jgi:acyl dehydratase
MELDPSRPHLGRWFEELTPGLVIHHAVTRTVTESDNTTFSTLTMNPAALHLDHHYAASTDFGRPLVNSLFTLGLMVGLTVFETTHGTAVANLGFEEVTFPSPVFPGDTIHCRSEVLAARASSSRPTQGIVTFEHVALNQDDAVVATCRRVTLMHRRPT